MPNFNIVFLADANLFPCYALFSSYSVHHASAAPVICTPCAKYACHVVLNLMTLLLGGPFFGYCSGGGGRHPTGQLSENVEIIKVYEAT